MSRPGLVSEGRGVRYLLTAVQDDVDIALLRLDCALDPGLVQSTHARLRWPRAEYAISPNTMTTIQARYVAAQ